MSKQTTKQAIFMRTASLAVATLLLMPLMGTPANADAGSIAPAQNVALASVPTTAFSTATKIVLPFSKSTTKTTANLYLRQKASTSSKSLGIMKKGSAVQLTGKKSGKWVQLRYGSKTGWASSSYLKTTKTAAPTKQYRYAQRDGNMYKTYSKNDKRAVGTLKKGAKVEWRKWNSSNRRDEVKVNGKWVWTDITATKPPAAAPAKQYRYAQSTGAYFSTASKANTKPIGTLSRGTKVEWRKWDSKNRRDEVKVNGKWVWSNRTAPKAPSTEYRYVQSDDAYFASASRNDTRSIGSAKKGTKLEWRTWDSVNRRDEVKVNGKWVWSNRTSPKNPNAAPAKPAPPKPAPKPQDKNIADYGAFTSANLNLRKGPGTNHASITKVPSGNKVIVTHESPVKGWVKIKHGSQTGYVSSAYLTKTGKYSVAVYGTLRTGQSAYSVMGKYQQKNVNQQIAKSSLYQLWNRNLTFLTSGPKSVVAEQFQYGDSNGAAMMKRLDIYESGVNYQGKPMYARQRVTMADGSVSWAYKTTSTGEKVAKASGNLVSSGDFLKRS